MDSDKTISEITPKIVADLSSTFGGKYNDFIQMMKDRTAILTGSYILNIIDHHFHGQTDQWKSHDLDMFVPVGTREENEEFSYGPLAAKIRHLTTSFRNKYHLCSNIEFVDKYNSVLTDIFRIDSLGVPSLNSNFIKNIMCRNSYSEYSSCVGINLQIIYIYCSRDYESMINYIKHEFDYSICKNAFYFISDRTPRLFIEDLDGIKNKVAMYDPKKAIFAKENRVEKYQKRGYKIISPSSLVHYIPKCNAHEDDDCGLSDYRCVGVRTNVIRENLRKIPLCEYLMIIPGSKDIQKLLINYLVV